MSVIKTRVANHYSMMKYNCAKKQEKTQKDPVNMEAGVVKYFFP